jgi:hypothetical protein
MLGEKVEYYDVVEIKVIDVLKGYWDQETLRYMISSDRQFWLSHNFEIHEPGIWLFKIRRGGNPSLRRYLPKYHIYEVQYFIEND